MILMPENKMKHEEYRDMIYLLANNELNRQ